MPLMGQWRVSPLSPELERLVNKDHRRRVLITEIQPHKMTLLVLEVHPCSTYTFTDG